MAARLLRCSPSSLALFTDCPRAYWYANVARPRPTRPPLNAYRAVGVSVHLALSWLWDDPATSPAELVGDAWTAELFTDPARSDRWLTRAQDWVSRYASTVDRSAQPVGVERTVSMKTPALALSGRVDRVDDRGGRLVVVDYKAGHRPPEPGSARTGAMPLYVIAAGRTLNRPCWRAELHHLPTGQVHAAVFDRAALARQLERAENTAADIAAATDTLEAGAHLDDVFPARPGPLCGHCDWRPDCPAGQAVPEADPEALLDRWETAA